MKPTNVCLSKSEISALLSSDLLPDETASAEQHIADCEACRTAIESMIADSRWWNDAQESLAAFSSRARSEADSSHEAEPTSTEQMLSLLGPTDDPEKIGRIAEYEVIGIIGRGGMGVVFKAFDPRLNRFVAIKMLLPHLAASGAARKRFAREGQAAAAVVDDYVLPIYAVSEWKGVPYLVTQYSRGTTLQKRVQSEGPLEVKEILRLGMQTARGLAAAHAQGLVHRDVKPSNILLDGSVERAMLTDFGLARAVDDASITRTGVIAGTPQYMSPEQARGGSVDARSDLFSLGCVLYFLCTGHPPFRADNSYAILRLITDEEPRSIREINPDIPAWLCSIVQKLMAKRAEDRYGSASEVADILEECLAHVQQPTTVALPESLRNRTRLDQRTFGSVARGVAIMVLMLVVCVGCFMFLQSSPPPDIAGVWRSIEWGTVTMQAEGEGKYRGSITDALLAAGTNPHADHPTLKNLDWSQSQCTVCHEGQRGTVELSWSEAERRFNGTWQIETRNGFPKSGNITGRLSVRRVGNQLRGASTSDDDTLAIAQIPRLADFAWEQSSERKKGYEHSDAMQQFIESLTEEQSSESNCTTSSRPDNSRIIFELENQHGLKRNSLHAIYNKHNANFHIAVEPVYDRHVAVREYPEIGRASLHLLRHECHVTFIPVEGVDWPLKRDGKPVYETTLFVDSDHLHREPGTNEASSADQQTAKQQKTAELLEQEADESFKALELEIEKLVDESRQTLEALTPDQRERAEHQHDLRQVVPAKYLAFEEKFRGTNAGFRSLLISMSYAGSLADPTCPAAVARNHSVDRLMDHYLQHHDIEKSFQSLTAGPPVPRHHEFLQAVFERNTSRRVRAEVLIAQIKVMRGDLDLISRLSEIETVIASAPESWKPMLEQNLRRLQSANPDTLRSEANRKIELLKSFGQESVAEYGFAFSAASDLSHAINRVQIGKEAPELEATTITGQLFRLSQLLGKTVVLVFAHDEADDNDTSFVQLRKLAKDYKDRDVEVVIVLQVLSDHPRDAAIVQRSLPGTVLPQPENGPIFRKWGIEYFNVAHIVTADGKLLPMLPMPMFDEATGYDAKQIRASLDSLLKVKQRENEAESEMDHDLEPETEGNSAAHATAALPARDRLSSASRLVTTIPGVDHLEADLKTLLDLTSKTEQRQWVHVQGYTETFFHGIEKTRPIEIQHVPSIGDGTTLFWVPLPEGDDSFKIFKSNLESLGYLLQKQEQDVESLDLYRVGNHLGGNEFGWIRINLEEKLACIALTHRVEAMHTLRDQIVAAKPVANPANCSLAIAMTNADHSAEAQEYRRRAFQSYRDQTIKHMAAKGPGVLPAQLNDWLTTTWLDEYQLLSAEGSKISARVVLDRSKPAQANAEMTFTASAIPNTALAASLSQLASSHDTYATWPTAESSILSLRVNAPVSQLRQDKLQSLNNWFATELQKSLISLNEQDDTSKDAAEQLATGCRQVLSDVIQSGRCNAIIDSSVVDGQFQWIGSMVVPKPQLMTELLPLLTQLQLGTEFELSVRRVGNVDLHRVKITGRMQELLKSILQSEGQYFVGCDADKIWFACGPNALDSLVARIETLGPAQPRPDVFHLNAKVGTLMAPLIRVYEHRSQQSGSVNADQRQTQKRLHRLLGDLEDSTTNHDDSLSINVHASDDGLNATIKCDTGILRFFGKQIAEFSNENFE